jgi:hypothetical protein
MLKLKSIAACSPVLALLLVSSLVWANPFFNPSPATASKASTNPVVSPENFKNMVSTMSQQVKTDLQAQHKQLQPANTTYNNPSAPAPNQTFADSPAATNSAPTVVTPPANNTNSDVYTGFDNSAPSNKGAKPATNTSSGGWNIKY